MFDLTYLLVKLIGFKPQEIAHLGFVGAIIPHFIKTIPHHISKELENVSSTILKGSYSLNHTTNQEGRTIPIGRFALCYHCSPNIGNNMSYLKIDKRLGPKVLSFD